MAKPAFDPNQPFEMAQAQAKPAFDPSKPFEPVKADEPMSGSEAALIKFQQGSQLGLRPVVAGVGSAIGNAAEQVYDRGGLNLGEVKDAFLSGRKGANEEQARASKEHPYISTAADIGGSVATLPFLPAKGLAGAVKLGAGLGAAQAAGSANSPKEAAIDVAGGAALGGAGYGAAKMIGSAGDAISNSGVGQKIKSGLAKTASALTGVPDREIETYATQYDKVKGLLDEAGGSIPVAAEIQKENLQAAVKSTKDNLNSQISEALQGASPEKNIDIAPVVNKLQSYKSRLNPSLNPEAIKDVDNLIGRIGGAAPQGKANIQDLQQIKQFLGDQAANSFEGSALGFQVGRDGANAAKQGYLEAKNLMDTVGPEEIKNANRQLFQLHKIEDRINKNLIVPGKSDAALMAVGSGAQNRDALALQRLGQISGTDPVGQASILASANRFSNPTLSPAYGTGKALFPVTAGGAIGGGIGAVVGRPMEGAKIGAGIGAIASSPAALKLALDTGRISGQALMAVADRLGVNPENLNEMSQVLSQPYAQEILIRAMSDDNQAAAATPKVSTTIRTRSQLGK